MAPQQPPYVQPGEPLNDFLRSFWQRQINAAEQETPDYRHPPLPLARIKKVMKSDPDVKMIAADGALQFILGLVCPALTRSTHTQPQSSSARPARVCSTPHLCPPIPHEHLVFIAEITARAFIIADSNKRRTLSRSDIAKALGKSDQFDFLIDIVPRDEIPFPGVVASANGPPGKKPGPTPVATKRDTGSTSGVGNNQTSPITLDAPSENNEVLNQLESLLGSSNQPERPPLS